MILRKHSVIVRYAQGSRPLPWVALSMARFSRSLVDVTVGILSLYVSCNTGKFDKVSRQVHIQWKWVYTLLILWKPIPGCTIITATVTRTILGFSKISSSSWLYNALNLSEKGLRTFLNIFFSKVFFCTGPTFRFISTTTLDAGISYTALFQRYCQQGRFKLFSETIFLPSVIYFLVLTIRSFLAVTIWSRIFEVGYIF